jgi:hypothetical protein
MTSFSWSLTSVAESFSCAMIAEYSSVSAWIWGNFAIALACSPPWRAIG